MPVLPIIYGGMVLFGLGAIGTTAVYTSKTVESLKLPALVIGLAMLLRELKK